MSMNKCACWQVPEISRTALGSGLKGTGTVSRSAGLLPGAQWGMAPLGSLGRQSWWQDQSQTELQLSPQGARDVSGSVAKTTISKPDTWA